MIELQRIQLLEEESLEIERSWYEYNAMLILVSQFASDSKFKPDKERYDDLLTKYVVSFMEYNMIFNNTVFKYVPKELMNKQIKIDFNSNELIIYEEEFNNEGKSCSCKIS